MAVFHGSMPEIGEVVLLTSFAGYVCLYVPEFTHFQCCLLQNSCTILRQHNGVLPTTGLPGTVAGIRFNLKPVQHIYSCFVVAAETQTLVSYSFVYLDIRIHKVIS